MNDLDLTPELDQLGEELAQLTDGRPDVAAALNECLIAAAGQARRPTMLAGAAARVLLRYDQARWGEAPDLEFGVKLLQCAEVLARADESLCAILDGRQTLREHPDALHGPLSPPSA